MARSSRIVLVHFGMLVNAQLDGTQIKGLINTKRIKTEVLDCSYGDRNKGSPHHCLLPAVLSTSLEAVSADRLKTKEEEGEEKDLFNTLCTTQLATLSFNHSIVRTHSCS